jgi:2-iminobutanoate/2-iminopropanoate deaminase
MTNADRIRDAVTVAAIVTACGPVWLSVRVPILVSGQIPVRPGGRPSEVVGDTMQEQTRQALRNVQAILEAVGSSLDRVVKVTVLLARPDLYREINEAYAEFFPGPKPARAMVRFGADIPGVLVAIEAIALA